jgi:hypothetical protein
MQVSIVPLCQLDMKVEVWSTFGIKTDLKVKIIPDILTLSLNNSLKD